MTWLVVLWDILCLAVYPVTVLAPLFISLLGVLAAPIFHVVRVLVRICLLPLRILANLESFYIFFGVAALIGISAGFVLHFTLRYSYRLFNIEPPMQIEQERLKRAKLARMADGRLEFLDIESTRNKGDITPMEDSLEEWRRSIAQLKYEMANRRERGSSSTTPEGQGEEGNVLKASAGNYHKGAKPNFRRRGI